MKNFKKTIVFMLVAYFVGLAIILYNFSVSYAASFSDVPDADWIYISGGNINNTDLNKGVLDVPSRSLPAGRPSVFVDIPNCKYSETLSYYDVQSDYFVGENITLSSDNEVVLVLDYVNAVPGYKAGTLNLFAFSKSRIYFAEKGNWYDEGAWSDHGAVGKIDFTTNTYNNSGFYMLSLLDAYTTSDTSSLEYAFMSGKMKVFNTINGAVGYLKDGNLSDLAWQGGTPKQTYNAELAFTSFDMSVHDSNSFDDYYLEFIYKCPDEWLGKDPKLVINQTWDYNIYYFDIKGTSSPLSVNGSNTCALSVSGDKNSIKIKLGQLDCLKKVVSDNFLGQSSVTKRQILGSSFSMKAGQYFTYNGLPIMADGSCKVDKSLLSLSCVVYVNDVAGHDYVGSVDLITGDNTMATYTPDSNGNYTYNDDFKKSGHYYTNVGKDAAGNTTYNYYYYTTDNSKHEVTSKDSHDNTFNSTESPNGGGTASGDNSNNNVNNPTFNNNNNITIEGDNINNEVNNYVDDNNSPEKNKNFIHNFLGFFELLENNSFLGVFAKVFGWLPVGVSTVIVAAIGISACIGVFRFFRK